MKLTWNETRTAVTDESGNMASVDYWGDEQSAEASLARLANCTDCINCANCIHCTHCTNCTNCICCFNCTYCSHCTNCTNCTHCSNCTYCTSCINCSHCTDCINCTHCTDCKCSGKLGHYPFWICGGMAKFGCQLHAVEVWLAFTREQIGEMLRDGEDWYDRNWTAWTALLAAYRGVGEYKG